MVTHRDKTARRAIGEAGILLRNGRATGEASASPSKPATPATNQPHIKGYAT